MTTGICPLLEEEEEEEELLVVAAPPASAYPCVESDNGGIPRPLTPLLPNSGDQNGESLPIP
jgi:hypothetical protein